MFKNVVGIYTDCRQVFMKVVGLSVSLENGRSLTDFPESGVLQNAICISKSFFAITVLVVCVSKIMLLVISNK